MSQLPHKPKGQKRRQKSPEEKAAAERAKRRRFTEIAPARVNKAIRAINNVARCSVVSSYTYNEAEADAIVSALTTAVAAVKQSFQGRRQETMFKLPL